MKTIKSLMSILIIVTFQIKVSAFSLDPFIKDPEKKKETKEEKAFSIERANVYPFKHTFKLSCGYSNVINQTNELLINYQDTSRCIFGLQKYAPILSLTHEVYIGKVLSFAYSLSFANNRTTFDKETIGSTQISAFIKPKINIFRRKNIEGYAQLNIGVVYSDLRHDKIPSEIIERQLPQPFKMYTGFTPLGLNVRLTDKICLNFEGSFWSHETFSTGLKFKFKDNLNHPRNWVGMD